MSKFMTTIGRGVGAVGGAVAHVASATPGFVGAQASAFGAGVSGGYTDTRAALSAMSAERAARRTQAVDFTAPKTTRQRKLAA